ncbi:hypothetical protein GF345_00835 [Candidatus Woesearchaeota archaeon]|nr:hypothetical protein [Candidatus Woesearchaeota archaeon]
MVTRVILAAIIASIVWFVLGGILYMNTYSKKIFNKESKKSKAVSKWKNMRQFYAEMYFLGMLIPSIIFAFVYYMVYPSFPGGIMVNGFLFGLILMGIKIIPRFADMKLMTTYPKKLLTMDFIVGSINCFAVAFTIASIV